ncbi:MAG: amidohydrolase family protein [Chloroflexi bacterium]|nr:amidohydrolase family protein [Chloroflexota bacterium]
MKPRYVVNVHTHLHKGQDIAARVRLWRECNLRKVCILCMPEYPSGVQRASEGLTNEEFLPLLRQYGDIMVGMGALNLFDKCDGPDKVDWLKEHGFTGLKGIFASRPYNHEAYFPLYARAEALCMPILFHTGWLASALDGTDGVLGVNADNYRPYRLDKIARAFPNLKIIGAHLGKPHAEEALQMIDAFPNVYYDFSGGSGKKKHWRWILKALSPLPGADMADPSENLALGYLTKLCFATDNPEPPIWLEAAEHVLDGLQIPDDLRERYYWGNACEVFGWTEADLA